MKILIPHYGDDAVLERCRATLPDLVDVVVVDSNRSHLFFTEAINSYLRDHLRLENIWLLNNDCMVDASCYWELCEALGRFTDVGIIGCQQRLLTNPDQIWYGGSGDCWPSGQHKQGLVSLDQFQTPTYERWLTFASVVIRKDVFRDIGILDSHLRHIFSDSDFCLRARDAGWKCLYWPKAIVLHERGSSANHSDDRIARIAREDAVYFQRKWIGTKRFMDLMTEILPSMEVT